MKTKLVAKHLIRKIFFEDWALKLIALVITFGLWFGVTGLSTPTTKRLTVPLQLSIASNAQVTNVPQADVEIEISGDKRKIEQLSRGELTASVDLTESPTGDRVVLLTPETVYVPLPQGIKLVGVLPGRIGVNLESVMENDVEVRVVTAGRPAEGFEVYSSSPLPPRIVIRGPASVVKLIDHVEAGKVDISGKKDEFTARQVPVTSPDPKAAVLNTVVDIYFRIGEKRMERTFSLPVSGQSVRSANFTVYGPRSLLQKTKAEMLSVTIDAAGEPRVTLPPELQDLAEVRNLTIK